MAGEIVVYKNEFNTIPLREFTAVEMDLLFSIMSEMREKGTEKITLDFEELKELSNYQPTATARFVDDVERTYDKLISLNVKIGNAKKWTKFVFFTEYTVDTTEKTISIRTNPEFAYLINQLETAFTRLELEELTTLRGSYSKALYRQLKQYKQTGLAIFSIEDFRERLSIPKSYKAGNINQKVIDPALEELAPFFENLRCKRILGKGKNKRKIVKLQFSFEPQTGIQKDGCRTFRRESGEFYKKHIMEFDSTEIAKSFPDAPEVEGDTAPEDPLAGQMSVSDFY